MKTKHDLAVEILGNYENFGCKLKTSVFNKILSKLEKRTKDALKRALDFINNERGGAKKMHAAAYCIFYLTNCKLP